MFSNSNNISVLIKLALLRNGSQSLANLREHGQPEPMTLEVKDVTDILLAHRLIAGVKLHLETLCVQQKQQDFINPDPPKVLGIMGAGWQQVTSEQDPCFQSGCLPPPPRDHWGCKVGLSACWVGAPGSSKTDPAWQGLTEATFPG